MRRAVVAVVTALALLTAWHSGGHVWRRLAQGFSAINYRMNATSSAVTAPPAARRNTYTGEFHAGLPKGHSRTAGGLGSSRCSSSHA